MIRLGFSASALHRAALGATFIAVACLLVWTIERPRETDPVARPVADAADPAVQIWPVTIESTYPVAQWSVRVLGVEQSSAHQDAFTWSGPVTTPISSGSSGAAELLVTAKAVATDAAPNHGLRLRLGAAAPLLVWGDGDITATAEFTR